MQSGGLFKPLRQINDQDKRNLFAENFVRLHGLDLAAMRKGVQNDEFSRAAGSAPADPLTTLSFIAPQHKSEGTIYA